MINRHNIFVLSAAFLISAAIWAITLRGEKVKKQKFVSARIFKGAGGWGYDILLNDSVFIHQEFIPAIAGKKSFPEKQQAEKMARLIINKINNGRLPSVTIFEREQIYPSHTIENGGQGKCQ